MRDQRLAADDVGHHGLAHHRLEQLFLVGEVKVERPLGDAGAPRDILQPGRGETAFGEAGDTRGDDLARPGVLAPPPAGRWGRNRQRHVNNLPDGYLARKARLVAGPITRGLRRYRRRFLILALKLACEARTFLEVASWSVTQVSAKPGADTA